MRSEAAGVEGWAGLAGLVSCLCAAAWLGQRPCRAALSGLDGHLLTELDSALP